MVLFVTTAPASGNTRRPELRKGGVISFELRLSGGQSLCSDSEFGLNRRIGKKKALLRAPLIFGGKDFLLLHQEGSTGSLDLTSDLAV